ncbi:hypothetical protein CANARDRAFT_26329 [[Candida] arabinofermentans NRRL YB-2248]|uniref:RNase MRP protein 1 RNA binding domain-containing protein n=1 Tax=[Candida] arabinofermentans NRRL YB-2248 TaxID=983967 RepID=A0A1E4T8V0_9ASCO|nr:hypothetical protein CANARDRAFT_26329 [[Candida] arabinofermentans NRRL YB-2248]
MGLVDPLILQKLFTEFEILHLLYHRNSKQHSSSKWWKHFNILHRKLRTVLSLTIDIDELSEKKCITKVNMNNLKRQSFKRVKLTEKKSKKLIEIKEDQVRKVVKYLVKKLLPDCYYGFFSIIELGQFITLGFTLIGLISRIYCSLIQFEGLDIGTRSANSTEMKLMNPSEDPKYAEIKGSVDHEDFGDVIDLEELKRTENLETVKHNDAQDHTISKKRPLKDAILSDSSERKKKKSAQVADNKIGSSVDSTLVTDNSKKKKKKKKASSAMDDIFGF